MRCGPLRPTSWSPFRFLLGKYLQTHASVTNCVYEYSTNCLQTGGECIYASPAPDEPYQPESHEPPSPFAPHMAVSVRSPALEGPSPLSDYVGGSYETLPEPSKRLLRHCTLEKSIVLLYFGRVLICCYQKSRDMPYGASSL